MSFAIYSFGFLVFLVGVVWAAVVAGVPQVYIMIGAVLLIGIAILAAAMRPRPKHPPAS